MENKTKACIKCQEVLEVSADNFHRNRNRTDGFENICKDCNLARQHGLGTKEEYIESVKNKTRCRRCRKYRTPDSFSHFRDFGRCTICDTCLIEGRNITKDNSSLDRRSKAEMLYDLDFNKKAIAVLLGVHYLSITRLLPTDPEDHIRGEADFKKLAEKQQDENEAIIEKRLFHQPIIKIAEDLNLDPGIVFGILQRHPNYR